MMKMCAVWSKVCALFLVFGLAACAGVTPGYEQPQVSITSFTLAPESTGAAPKFNIGIRVVNPNRVALPLRGMSYTVEVDGNRILNGAQNDLPRVAAYSTEEFVIQGSPDLLGGIRLISDLFARQRTSLGYTFRARIDAGSLLPLTIEETGNFGLPAGRN